MILIDGKTQSIIFIKKSHMSENIKELRKLYNNISKHSNYQVLPDR